jgi:hypothetical protein
MILPCDRDECGDQSIVRLEFLLLSLVLPASFSSRSAIRPGCASCGGVAAWCSQAALPLPADWCRTALSTATAGCTPSGPGLRQGI